MSTSTNSLGNLGTWMLVHWFSALLPPVDKDEKDYYEVLEVPRNASFDEIRKAYKKQSLKLHPDKVMQRGGDVEEARHEFMQVQEAHDVLSDDSKRARYHAVQCSPTRYRFITSEGAAHPQQVYENLGRASCPAKSRIFFVLVVLLGILLLQPVLLVIKINQDFDKGGALADTDWIVILIPAWVLHGLVVLLWLALLVAAPSEAKPSALLTFLEQVSLLSGEVLLALRWDRTLTNSYGVLGIPFYVWMGIRTLQALFLMSAVKRRVSKMISQTYLDHKILDGGRSYEELNDEERAELATQYLLVHVPPDFSVDVELLSHMDEDELEALRVEASPEYEQSMQVYKTALQKFAAVLFLWAPFVALVITRADKTITCSWWLVFLPFWVHLGLQFLGNCFTCCCGTVVGQEVVLGPHAEEGDKHGEEERKEDNAETTEQVRGTEGNDPDTPFASADGSMREFNSSVTKEETAGTSDDSQPATSASHEDVPDTSAEASPGEEAKQAEDETTEPTPAESNKSDEGNDESSLASEEFREWERETYRKWKAAYEEAENSSREAQAKAQMACCGNLWQVMFLCLIVAKIEHEYEREGSGYNAIWIIFPALLVAGLVLCCCACFVYGAGVLHPESTSSDQAADDKKNEEVDEEDPPSTKPETDDPVEPKADDPVEPKTDEPDVAVAAAHDHDDDDLD